MTSLEDKVKELTEEVLAKMALNINAIAVTREGNNILRVNIDTEEPSLLIGWHGENINALQHILKNLLWNQEEIEENIFLIVDTDDYKKRQEENVIDMAEESAKKVSESNTVELLPPMSPYFRRIIHLHFSENPDFEHIETSSEGEGDHRQIKISYK